MIGGVAMAAAVMAQKDEEMAKLLDAHGVAQQDALPSESSPRLKDPAEMARRMKQKRMADSIDDKPAFCAAVIDRMVKVKRESAEKLGLADSDPWKAHAEATLHDVEIEGDAARGKQSIAVGGKTFDVPVEFRRIDGGWLVHVPGID